MDMKPYMVIFLDSGREPECSPNPAYPDGMEIDGRRHKDAKSCAFELPYPAPRCGAYVVKCNQCGYSMGITVAGRPDDPKLVTVNCKLN